MERMRHVGLVAVVAAALFSAAAVPDAAATPTAHPHAAARPTALESSIVAGVNEIRARHGLARLRLSASLSAAARAHSRSMATRGFFAHASADGTSFDVRVRRFYPARGFRFWSVGENLVWASPDLDAARAIELWLASPPHRRNILTNRWREIGISVVRATASGVYGGKPITVVTVDFGVRR